MVFFLDKILDIWRCTFLTFDNF